jgi:glycosyltransferase involved in cell wall biosynthesis
MKIVFIEPSGAGGVAHYTFFLARALGRQGVDCEILTSKRWALWDLPENAQVRRIFRGRQTNPITVLWQCMKMRKSPDIVHWQSTTHPLLLRRLMYMIPKKGPRWVFTVHNVLPHETNSSSFALYREIYSQMDGLIFHTRFSREEFDRIFPNFHAHHAIIPVGEYGFLGAATNHMISTPHNRTVLFFGNIRPYKGLATLLHAFALVKKSLPDARLRIVGQALEPFEPYAELIHTLQLETNVDLRIEYVPDEEIPEIFASAAVAALPYTHIDQSAVLLLALALRKAVVASRIGGIAEVIRDGETGLMAPPNDPPALARAILDFLENPDYASKCGQAARDDVMQRFSWDAIARQTIDFYMQLSSP